MLISKFKRLAQKLALIAALLLLNACEPHDEIQPAIKKVMSNKAPIAVTGDDLFVSSGELAFLYGDKSTDPDGSITGFLWKQLSGESVTINTLSESNISFVAPHVGIPTTLEFQLTIIDNLASAASRIVKVIISPSPRNVFPFAHTLEDFTAIIGTKVNLSGVNSYDSDGKISRYHWQQLKGYPVTIVGQNNKEASFTAPDITNHERLVFSLSITDNDGAVSTNNIKIIIADKSPRKTAEITATSSQTISGSKQTLNTSMTLTADNNIIPHANEIITFGLPIAQGLVKNTDEISIYLNGIEQAFFVKKGLLWHWQDNSIRSITLQLQGIDMRSGNLTLSITNTGRDTSKDLTEQPHHNGWAKAGEDKAYMPYPRIFALHDKHYLATTALIPSYTPSPAVPDDFEKYQLAQFQRWSSKLNFNKSSGVNWLFDRSSAYFKVYMTTGRVEFLKEAFISKQFYFSKVRKDNVRPAKSGGRGCWQWKGVACADGKYIAPQQAKLAWALLGDNSQWDDSLIIDMALQSDLGWNQYASRDPYNKENEGFTERGAGMAGLAEISAFEITADKKILQHLNERIESLSDMQQTEKPWDISNNWIPKTGGFEHSFDVHEGNHNEKSVPLGDSNDRAFSPWMSENIADFLWQSYWITKHEKIPEILRRLGNAVEEHGFTTRYSTTHRRYQLKSAFSQTKQTHTKSCNKSAQETDLVYFTSKWADDKTLASGDFWPYYSDTHNIETVLILAAAYYFEPDYNVQLKLSSRIDKLIKGWAHEDCAKVFSNVHRLFNWQHRSNSIRTWQWIEKEKTTNTSNLVNFTNEQTKKALRSSQKIIKPFSKKIASHSDAVSFSDMTQVAISYGPIAHQPFWIGMPDVNGDGCSDLFVGTHSDNVGNSQMWLHDVLDGQCKNSFSYYSNALGKYSQKGKGRISSRYIFANITGKKNGLPDFFGSDSDGGDSVIYPIAPTVNTTMPPVYNSEIVGCRGGKNRCVTLDINGDGRLELLTSASVTDLKRRIYDPISNTTIIPKLTNKYQPGYKSSSYLIVDIDGDSWPDIVSGEAYGYWRYNPITQTLDNFVYAFQQAKRDFSRSGRNPTSNFQVSFDYDNDGDFDILFGSGQWGPKDKDNEFYLSLQRNNGDGSFTNVTDLAGGGTWTDGSLKNTKYWTTYAGIYPGDFNNDGYIDFMTMAQSYSDSPRLFKNNGDGTFSLIKNLIKNGGAGVDVFRPWGNVADWNNDGFLDVAILSDGIGDVEGLRLYKNNANENHWLKIRARGLNKNTDGYHTKFIIKESQTKQILATRYHGNYNVTDARFIAHAGLGNASSVDLVIEFPHGGPVFQYLNIAVDQELVVFRDGCLLQNWLPGQGWPTDSDNQRCKKPD
ncbi:VCBS repeat-containing protein [Colwellia sp. Bg11-12]|uniref:FG-GAP repeat domain-containing protein n=1 Tax=Colwellia sp. Bg11-12 TaxID=2759817 RepID=UPI0015F5CDD4|nr:VCBS repeat-containing protein [Colwellia sp. Bg11-12]MBA6265142.1 VCBS repeat-containing protein [Colwellia sp. Bg11-12]